MRACCLRVLGGIVSVFGLGCSGVGSGSESDFEIASLGEDEGLESGGDFTTDGDSVSSSGREREITDNEVHEESRENGKGSSKPS